MPGAGAPRGKGRAWKYRLKGGGRPRGPGWLSPVVSGCLGQFALPPRAPVEKSASGARHP